MPKFFIYLKIMKQEGPEPWIALVLSDLLFSYNRCARIRQERVNHAKSKYDLMKILSELVYIPQMYKSIGCCMTFPIFYFLHRAVVFHIQLDVEHCIVW